jgi:hypothetical protein
MKSKTYITWPVLLLTVVFGAGGFLWGNKNARVKQYSVNLKAPVSSPATPNTNAPIVPNSSLPISAPKTTVPATNIITKTNSQPAIKKKVVPVSAPAPVVTTNTVAPVQPAPVTQAVTSPVQTTPTPTTGSSIPK